MAKKKGAFASPFVPEEEQPYPIPENWCWTKLGTYIDFATDYVANGSFADLKANVQIYKEENYALMVKTADFANEFTKSLTYTDKHGYEYLGKSVLHGGELILSNIGSIGKVFRVPFLNRPMTLASNSVMIKCYNERDYDWLYYFFLSPIGLEELLSITTGTAVLKFNKTDLKTIALPVPPFPEQHRIVSRIESLFVKLDEAKEKAQAVVDGFELRKSAILHKAFTGELTERWRKEHGVGLDSWEEICFGNLILSGPQNGLYKSKDAYGSGVKILRIDSFYEGNIEDWETLKRLTLSDAEIKLYELHLDEIVINRVNSMPYLGKSALIRKLPEICVFESNMMRISLNKERAIPEFIIKYLNSPEGLSELRKNAKQAVNQASINQKDVKNVIIRLPSWNEQAEIVCVLDYLQNQEQKAKSVAENVLAQIDTMKKAILARAFRGELGTNDPEEEWAGEMVKIVAGE